MTRPVVTVSEDAPLADVVSTMDQHQIRRVLVVDASGACAGIIAQADVAMVSRPTDVGHMVREVSKVTGQTSH
jgi:predicted transcriptional regulator